MTARVSAAALALSHDAVACLDRELQRARAERDTLRSALEAATHAFVPGRYGCALCGTGPTAPVHQTPERVLGALPETGDAA